MPTYREILEYEKVAPAALALPELEALAMKLGAELEALELRTTAYNRLFVTAVAVFSALGERDAEGVEALARMARAGRPKIFELAMPAYVERCPAASVDALLAEVAASAGEQTPMGRALGWYKYLLEDLWRRRGDHQPYARKDDGQSWPPLEVPAAPVAEPPAQPPATRTIADLAAFAREHDLDAVVPRLAELTWPTLRLIRDRRPSDDLPVGASKLGGAPDLPAEFEWPRFEDDPMAFLGQIDLAAIATHRAFTHLPADGMLSFFFEAGRPYWEGEEGRPGPWRVVYNPPGTSLVRRSFPDDLLEELRYPPASLRFYVDTSLPGSDIPALAEDPEAVPPELDEEEADAWEAMVDALLEDSTNDEHPRHRMFGFPDEVQHSMHLAWEAERHPPPQERSRLLLQLDSDPTTPDGSDGMYWGSGGMLYVWVRRHELGSAQFSEVDVVLQFT